MTMLLHFNNRQPGSSSAAHFARTAPLLSFVLAFAGLALNSSSAVAQRVPLSVSLNGGQPWTMSGDGPETFLWTNGDPVAIQPGGFFDVSMVVEISTNGWQWTQTRVGNTAFCLDTQNFYCTNCTATIGFIVTAIPHSSGTYDLTLRTYGDKRREVQCDEFDGGIVRLQNAVFVCAGGDCNANGVPDQCDVINRTSRDCNRNFIPDECDVAAGTDADCNNNDRLDSCDIHLGDTQDCNSNGVPDECDGDCNSNGAADECDIAAGTSTDCNANGMPDDCEIASGRADDCNTNGVLDGCETFFGTAPDIDRNGVPDTCDPDCNNNGLPDDLDVRAGASSDCDAGGVPDECQADSDGDGTIDACDGCPTDADATSPPCRPGAAAPPTPSPNPEPVPDQTDSNGLQECESELECFDFTDSEGRLVRQLSKEPCGLLGTIDIESANPLVRFDWTLFDAETGLGGAPGPEGGTALGFGNATGVGRTLTVSPSSGAGGFVVTIAITLCPEEVAALSIVPAEWQLYVLDESKQPPAWTPAGTTYKRQVPPTNVVGDLGYDLLANGSVTWWVVRDKLSTFAVGRRSIQPIGSDAEPPAVGPADERPSPDPETTDDVPPVLQSEGVDQRTPNQTAGCGSGLCGATGSVTMCLLLVGLLGLRLISAGRNRRTR